MTTNTLFLDIETIPADESHRDVLKYLYARKSEKKKRKTERREVTHHFLTQKTLSNFSLELPLMDHSVAFFVSGTP